MERSPGSLGKNAVGPGGDQSWELEDCPGSPEALCGSVSLAALRGASLSVCSEPPAVWAGSSLPLSFHSVRLASWSEGPSCLFLLYPSQKILQVDILHLISHLGVRGSEDLNSTPSTPVPASLGSCRVLSGEGQSSLTLLGENDHPHFQLHTLQFQPDEVVFLSPALPCAPILGVGATCPVGCAQRGRKLSLNLPHRCVYGEEGGWRRLWSIPPNLHMVVQT